MSHLTPRQHGNTTSNKVPYPEHDTHASTWPPRPSSIVVGAAAAAAPGAEASSVNWIASAAGRVCGELSRRAKLLAEPILRADEKPPLDRPPPSRAWVCVGLVVGRGADATQITSRATLLGTTKSQRTNPILTQIRNDRLDFFLVW